ncbi:MAG: class I SAM-dependent methyltransferase [Clostridiales Family XIII bacterium]|jgi:SAM-dependent methyltransferase|nr:class I SAM-dependent methyltransferase [Clostridiales Family XIII bacterium]
MKIANEILNILANCEIKDGTVYLPPEQLDRKTYEAVNKCLVNIGGKWNRSKKGHVFDHDPTEEFENLLFTGETEDMKKKFQFFPTPPEIAKLVCDLAELTPESVLLEPSCGAGALADEAAARGVKSIVGIEINPDMKKYLEEKPYDVFYGDFMTRFEPEDLRASGFDRVIMNPPFTRQQDIDHIMRAYDCLVPGGVLVAVCGTSPFFRDNGKSVAFREWLDDSGAEIIDVPEGAFKVSGTNIRTKIIKIRKEA